MENRLSKNTIDRLHMRTWAFKKAFPQSDIIWEDLTADPVISWMKTAILWVLLISFSILLITPAMLIAMGTELLESLGLDNVGWLDAATLTAYVSSAMTMLLNVIIIPFLIDMMVLMEDYQTRSERQISILNRNFIFMLLNSMLLPLTELTSIKGFIDTVDQ